jgi:hypothetical protein
MWKEYLYANGHDKGHTNNQIPSDAELIEWPLQEIVGLLVHSHVISRQEAMVHNNKHNCGIDVLTYEYGHHPENATVYLVFGFVGFTHFV